jgi:hypothetical protein
MATIEVNRYNAKEKTLDIVFGYEPTMQYTFKGVPKKIAAGFDTAESKGKYFHANIRGKFGEPEKAIIG